jgi:predicted O-methyltransferase YrrM
VRAVPYVLVSVAGFLGVTALVVAWGLWRQGRRGPGMVCLLAAGAALTAGAQYKLLGWASGLSQVSALTPRSQVFLGGCLALLAVGAALTAVGQRGSPGPDPGVAGPLARGAAVALIITLTELAVVQERRYNHLRTESAGYTDSIRQLVLGSGPGPGADPKSDGKRVTALPIVEVDTTGVAPAAPSRKGYHFTEDRDWFTRHAAVWATVLAPYKGRPDVRYLEVGLFEGRSAFWVLDNILTDPTACLTGIDPFSDPHYTPSPGSRFYKDVFYDNLKRSGAGDRVKIIEGYSQVELRTLPLDSFDIIYIDGSHTSADVLEDAFLSWRLLKDGGTLVFDDYLLHAGMKRSIDTFYAVLSDRFEPVHVGWQVFLRKTPSRGSPADPWR